MDAPNRSATPTWIAGQARNDRVCAGQTIIQHHATAASNTPPVNSILNIAAYRFVQINDTALVQERLRDLARTLELKGTILIAEEGINFFLAGPEQAVRDFLAGLRTDARLAPIEVKESWSAAQPFGKLLVKVKREIIRMDHPAIRPDFSRQDGRAPSVDAATVRRWLDAGHDDLGRPVVTLDTRNAFEVDHGTFDGAIDWRINKFTEFPAAFKAHQKELQDKTVVSFCTGGIRCEKAAIFMREEGLEHVYQLEGGILKYFEETAGEHYSGTCFVFDERESLAPDLTPVTRTPPRG
jgi:UPF0176 protein